MLGGAKFPMGVHVVRASMSHPETARRRRKFDGLIGRKGSFRDKLLFLNY